MTANEVLATVRLITNESSVDEASQAPTNTQYIPLINAGMELIASLRPDALDLSDGRRNAFAAITATTESVCIADKFARGPLVDYLAMRSFQVEGGEKKDLARAAEHRATFMDTVRAI